MYQWAQVEVEAGVGLEVAAEGEEVADFQLEAGLLLEAGHQAGLAEAGEVVLPSEGEVELVIMRLPTIK